MEQTHTYDRWIGTDAYDSEGQKLGDIKDIYYDDETGRPEWVALKPGMFKGMAFVPIHNSTTDSNGNLRIAFRKEFIEAAPDVDTSKGEHLDPADEQRLWDYFGFDRTQRGTKAYGTDYGKLRADADYKAARYDRERGQWQDEGEITAEATAVSQTAQVVDQPETVRLRKYRRTEMVPVTKEEIRVEKVGPDDQTGTTTDTRRTQ
jgi:hypothetical protein